MKDLASSSLKINRALWVLGTLLPIIIIPVKGLPDIFNAAKAPILSLGAIYITFHLIKIGEFRRTSINFVLCFIKFLLIRFHPHIKDSLLAIAIFFVNLIILTDGSSPSKPIIELIT